MGRYDEVSTLQGLRQCFLDVMSVPDDQRDITDIRSQVVARISKELVLSEVPYIRAVLVSYLAFLANRNTLSSFKGKLAEDIAEGRLDLMLADLDDIAAEYGNI